MNFIQAMIVPTMVSVGMGSLLVGQGVSWVDVSYAAPAKPGFKIKKSVLADTAPALPKPVEEGKSTEFGAGAEAGGQTISATTETQLSVKAVEAAGREDPFIALVPPDPGSIVPPEKPPTPPPPVPPVVVATPKPPPTPKPVVAVPPPVVGTPKPTASAGPAPFGGDKVPTALEPQWLVRGVVSTGYERICMLEGKGGNNISARVGEQLSDGSRVEAISNRGVTFIRGGRRYVKIIGGIL